MAGHAGADSVPRVATWCGGSLGRCLRGARSRRVGTRICRVVVPLAKGRPRSSPVVHTSTVGRAVQGAPREGGGPDSAARGREYWEGAPREIRERPGPVREGNKRTSLFSQGSQPPPYPARLSTLPRRDVTSGRPPRWALQQALQPPVRHCPLRERWWSNRGSWRQLHAG